MSQGLRNPLEEKDAEIERLRRQIEIKDAAIQSARDWLPRVAHTTGSAELDSVLQVALECK